jgi:hypothetical protein
MIAAQEPPPRPLTPPKCECVRPGIIRDEDTGKPTCWKCGKPS